jgi:hypothetical protein
MSNQASKIDWSPGETYKGFLALVLKAKDRKVVELIIDQALVYVLADMEDQKPNLIFRRLKSTFVTKVMIKLSKTLPFDTWQFLRYEELLQALSTVPSIRSLCLSFAHDARVCSLALNYLTHLTYLRMWSGYKKIFWTRDETDEFSRPTPVFRRRTYPGDCCWAAKPPFAQ